MGLEKISVSDVIPAAAEAIFRAWLDGREHERFTGGGSASVDARIGGQFTAHGGYIEGTTIALEPYRRIVQRWRTSEFPPDANHSFLEVWLEPVSGGTRITIQHSEIPEGQGARYAQGWKDHYFAPMRTYFARAEQGDVLSTPVRKPVAKPPTPRVAAKKAAAAKPAKRVGAKKAAAKKPVAPVAKKKAAAKKPMKRGAVKNTADKKRTKKPTKPKARVPAKKSRKR